MCKEERLMLFEILILVAIVVAILIINKKNHSSNGAGVEKKNIDGNNGTGNSQEVEKADCQHEWNVLFSPFYKEQLFKEVTYEGKEILQCSKCKEKSEGENIVDKFMCKQIPKILSCDIDFLYKGVHYNAGTYKLVCALHYMIANKRAPELDIDKNDKFILLQCQNYLLSKNDDFPVGLGYDTFLTFVDDEDKIIYSEKIGVKTIYEIEKELNEELNGRKPTLEEKIAKINETNNILLRVPEIPCELKVEFIFNEISNEN